MVQFIQIPIETDPDALAQDAFEWLAARNPGWEPSDFQLDTWLLEATARMAATLREMASDVSMSIFREFGSLINVPPIDAVASTGVTTWNLTDTLGHIIPDGTHLGINDDAGNMIDFVVAGNGGDIVIAPGSNQALNVQISAVDAGSDASGLGGVGTLITLLDDLSWVSTVSLNGPTAAGSDAEDDDVYLNRLAENLTLMGPHPVIANDFAIMAKNVAGVERALALDNWDPVAHTGNHPRMVAIAAVDSLGNAVGSSVKTAIHDLLAGMRESTFVINIFDPTYTTVDVQWDVNLWPGWIGADVTANINAALANFLSPTNWGQPPTGDSRQWYLMPNVKVNDEAVVIGNVEGVKDVNSVQHRVSPAAFGTADIVLTGDAPLPRAGVITGTTH